MTKFETFGEKPKLSIIKTSSWIWKLDKWVFGKKIMNPREMKNLCLYTWLSVAALFLVIPVTIIKLGFILPLTKFDEFYEKYVFNYINNWLDGISEDQAYNVFENRHEYTTVTYPKKFMKKNPHKIWRFLKEKHGFKSEVEAIQFFENIYSKRKKSIEAKRKKLQKISDTRRIKARNRQNFLRNLNEKMSLVFQPFRSIWSWLIKAFTFKSTDKIVKITKKFIGILITLLLIGLIFYIVQFMVAIILLIIESWNGPVVLAYLIKIVIGLVSFGILAGVIYLSLRKIQDFIDNYKAGNELTWYGNLTVFLWNIISNFAIYVFWVPIRFIFVTFLWEFVAISLIWGIVLSFGNIFRTTTGVFGEYFGNGYNDYCPGIEVIDE